MFIHPNPIWSAAEMAAQAAQGSTNPDESFVETLLGTFIEKLSDEGRDLLWRVVDGMDPSDPDRTFCAFKMLRALRHADRCGLAVSDIIAEFGRKTSAISSAGRSGLTAVSRLEWLPRWPAARYGP